MTIASSLPTTISPVLPNPSHLTTEIRCRGALHRTEYRDLAEVRASIHEFPKKVYNQKRLRWALGYVPPAEFDANLASRANKDVASRQLPE